MVQHILQYVRLAGLWAGVFGAGAAVAAAKLPQAAEKLPDVKIYVSPKGKDANPGLAAGKPVQTLPRALEIARRLDTDGPRTILLADGTYPVTAPIAFKAQDISVTVKAQNRGKAVVSGFAEVTGWQQDAYATNLLVAPMPFKPEPERLYLFLSGDKPATLSKYPEKGRLGYDATKGAGNWQTLNYREGTFPKDFDPKTLDLKSVWLVLPQEWATTRTYISSIDAGAREIHMKNKSGMELGEFNQGFLLMNTRPGLTKPGTWMFEADAGRIVYWPREGETPDNLKCRVTQARCLFDIRNVSSLVLDGLVFEGCHTLMSPPGVWSGDPLAAAVSVKCARKVVISNCEVRHSASAGISFLKGDASKVVKSHVHHVGASCIEFVDGGVGNVEVEGCELDHGGILSASSPLLYLQIVKATTRNNHIHHGPGNGAVMWSRDSLFISNHIHHVMSVQRDGAGLYGAYNFTLVKNNYVHDTGAWPCLYADEGSQHTVFTGNLCKHWWPTHAHCTRFVSVTNNTFICPNGHRFSFQGSGGGRFTDNKLYLSRDVNGRDYLSLESCTEWARNDVWVVKPDGSKNHLGKRAFACGVPDRVRPVLALQTPAGATPISADGKVLDATAWLAAGQDVLHPYQLAEGGSMYGVPGSALKFAWDKSRLYVHVTTIYNAFCGYLGCRNLEGTAWGHWDGARLYFPNGLWVDIFANGKIRSSDPAVLAGDRPTYKGTVRFGLEYAASIPISALGLAEGDIAGQKIPFNVCCRNEDHRTSAWAYRPKGKDVLTGELEFQ